MSEQKVKHETEENVMAREDSAPTEAIGRQLKQEQDILETVTSVRGGTIESTKGMSQDYHSSLGDVRSDSTQSQRPPNFSPYHEYYKQWEVPQMLKIPKIDESLLMPEETEKEEQILRDFEDRLKITDDPVMRDDLTLMIESQKRTLKLLNKTKELQHLAVYLRSKMKDLAPLVNPAVDLRTADLTMHRNARLPEHERSLSAADKGKIKKASFAGNRAHIRGDFWTARHCSDKNKDKLASRFQYLYGLSVEKWARVPEGVRAHLQHCANVVGEYRQINVARQSVWSKLSDQDRADCDNDVNILNELIRRTAKEWHWMPKQEEVEAYKKMCGRFKKKPCKIDARSFASAAKPGIRY